MAKEMNVTCDFLKHQLNCVLPENMMDILLKVRTKSGDHTFREDVYTRTLKYRRWNNELRPFRSLKTRVAYIFRKRNLFSDDSRATSTQTIVNEAPEQDKGQNKDSETDSKRRQRESVHSNLSDLMPTEENKPTKVVLNKKRTVRNIVLVPYKPKPKDWGSWKIKSPYATSTVASPILDDNSQTQTFNQNNENDEGKLTYIPNSPYYEPVHSPQFYGDE